MGVSIAKIELIRYTNLSDNEMYSYSWVILGTKLLTQTREQRDTDKKTLLLSIGLLIFTINIIIFQMSRLPFGKWNDIIIMCGPTVGKWSDTCVVLSQPAGKQFHHYINVPNLTSKRCQCISKILFLNMYELQSNDMCLVHPHKVIMGHLQDQNRNRLQPSGCGHGLITVDETENPI